MKKIFLIAAMAVASVAASAQDFKFGYVDFTELVQLMPEADSARVKTEAASLEAQETYQSMVEEYQTKGQQFQQAAQQDLQQLQNELQAPIYEKAQTVVNELAKAKGVAFVFEKTSLLYIDPAQGFDLTPEARKALNIPEGRTLETLQQELMAKAQAAQAQ